MRRIGCSCGSRIRLDLFGGVSGVDERSSRAPGRYDTFKFVPCVSKKVVESLGT